MANCRVGEILNSATEPEKQALDSALQNRVGAGGYLWSAKALSQAINKTSYTVGATTIKEHRRAACGCYQQ